MEVPLPPRLSWIPASALVDSRLRGNDDSKAIPAQAGIHTASTEDERVVAGTGVELPV